MSHEVQLDGEFSHLRQCASARHRNVIDFSVVNSSSMYSLSPSMSTIFYVNLISILPETLVVSAPSMVNANILSGDSTVWFDTVIAGALVIRIYLNPNSSFLFTQIRFWLTFILADLQLIVPNCRLVNKFLPDI